MGNQSYLNFKDELENTDLTPYNSISNRDPLEDVTGLTDAQDSIDDLSDEADLSAPPPPINPVKQAIAKRMAPPPPSSAPGDYSKDPLMQQFENQQKDLDQYRQAKLHSDSMTNFGQAAAQAAQGSNTPTADTALYGNMQKQGSDLLKSNEEDLDRRQKVIGAIEARKTRENNSANTAAYRQGMIGLQKDRLASAGEARDAAAKAKQDRLDSTNIGRANSLYQNPNISKETTKLNAARGVQTLVDSIRGGELTDSKNIRNQLTNMIATIELGSPGGVSDRHEMGIDTLYTRAKDALGSLTSSPTSTIPAKFLDQLESESHALGDRAAKNYANLTNGILSGADLSGGNPDVDPGQIHKLVSQRRSKFLSENGYDPDTGARKMTAQQEKASGPKPGDIEEGHRFKGGNPADPKNWENVGG